MARKLNATVYIDGKVYRPGDDVPADMAKRITNAGAWTEEMRPAKASAPKVTDDN